MINKKLLLSIIIFILVVVSAMGAAFAFYVEVYYGWGQHITTYNIVFKLNNNTIQLVEQVNQYDLVLLSRGDESPLDFTVEVSSNAEIMGFARVDIFLSLPQTSDNGQAVDQSFARAIEVHEKQADGSYRYVSMLDQFGTTTLEKIIPISSERTFSYKLVYSQGAGAFYEDKNFTLHVEADYEIMDLSAQEAGSTYAFDQESLFAAIDNASVGSTITMLGDVSVLLDKTIDKRVFLDLNGFTLFLGEDVNGEGVNFGFSLDDADTYTSIEDVGGIVDSFGTGGIATIDNSSQFSVSGGAVFVGDTIVQKGQGVHSPFVFSDISPTDVAALAQLNADQLANKLFNRGEIVEVFKHLNRYFESGSWAVGQTALNFALESLSVGQWLTRDAPDNIAIDDSAANNSLFVLTRRFEQIISVGGAAVNMSCRVVGTSPDAIADYLLSHVPNTVGESLFLPVYLADLQATVTWVSSNPAFLSAEGSYIEGGYYSLVSWANQSLELGVIVDTLGVQAYAEKEIEISILTPQQRTELIYNYEEIAFSTVNETIDFLSFIDNPNNIASLSGIEITLDQEANDNNGLPFIQVTNTNGYPTLTLLNKPVLSESVDVGMTITFHYGEESYTVNRTAKVVGFKEAGDIVDITAILQRDLENYVLSGDYEFFVKGNYNDNEVDYFVEGEHANYITVRNDNFVQRDATNEQAGGYYKFDGGEQYVHSMRYTLNTTSNEYYADPEGNTIFISPRYSFVNDQYILDRTGEYAVILDDGGNEVYVDYLSAATEGQLLTANYNTALTSGEIYDRITQIRVSPDRVPAVREIIASMFAKIKDITSPSGYEKESAVEGSADRRIVLTIVIDGVYHNTDDEIADNNLFLKLLEIFDEGKGNNDGWLQVKEAQIDWAANTVGARERVDGVYYNNVINLSNSNINSLKGIEYFTNAVGLKLSNNQLIDISYLSGLYNLKYLNLSSNQVTDINALEYLDSLQCLNLKSNIITDISPIRYLPDIRYLDISLNDGITDFSAMEEYDNLLYLDIRQTDNTNTDLKSVAYFLYLLMSKNDDIDIYRNSSSATKMTYSDTLAAGAAVLDNMVVIDEAYTTLYLPNTYVHNGQTYTISWEVYTENSPLTFNFDSTTSTTTYSIVSPLTDTLLEIGVNISSNSISYGTIAREFDLTLLKNLSQSVYIQTGADPNTAQLLTEVIVDPVLRSLLFTLYNVGSDTLTVGGTTYAAAEILTFSEMRDIDLDWSNRGITSLEGLEYLAPAITASLNLSNNPISDLSPIASLTQLQTLTLSGQNYDFTQLVARDGGGALVDMDASALATLNVKGCYELNSDKVLSQLYQVYLRYPNLAVRLDNETDWNPYLKPLSLYKMTLPTAHVFSDKNDTLQFQSDGYDFTFYAFDDGTYTYAGNTVNFKINDSSRNGQFSGNFSISTNNATIGYTRFAGYSDTVYAVLVLKGSDGKNDNITANHYVECKIDFNRNIVVDFTDGTSRILEDVFPGRSIRTQVLSKLASMTKSPDGKYHITQDALSRLDFGSTVVVVDGSYSSGVSAITGLKYLSKLQHLHIQRDANLGDGSELINLKRLSIGYSSVDLSGINIDLPTLESLYIGRNYNYYKTSGATSYTTACRYVIFCDESGENGIARFTNLKSLAVLDSNVYDWSGLAHVSSSVLSFLRIHRTSNKDYPNNNSNIAATVNVVDAIYTRYNGNVANTDDSQEYYIGSQTNNSDSSYIYRPDGYTGEEGEPWGAQSGDRTIDPTIVQEYAEFRADILDLGMKLNDEYYFNTNSEINTTQAIYLPKSTGEFHFGAVGTYHTMQFAIDWRVYAGADYTTTCGYFTNGSTHLTTTNSHSMGFGSGGTIAGYEFNLGTVSNSGFTLTTSVENDVYMIFEGRLGKGYYNGSGTYQSADLGAIKVFYYPVLVRASQGNITQAANTLSFANFTDEALRFEVAALMMSEGLFVNGCINTSNLSSVTSIDFSIDSITHILGGASQTNNFADFGTTNVASGTQITPRSVSSLINKVYSLNGIQLFSGLTSLNVDGNCIRDIPVLTSLTSLTTLTLSNNFIKDFSQLGSGSLGSVTTLDLSNNTLCSLANLSTYFPNLTTLNLSGNSALTAGEVASLSGLTSLTKLEISNTASSNDFNTDSALVDALLTLMGTRTDSISVTFHADGGATQTVTKDFLTAFKGETDAKRNSTLSALPTNSNGFTYAWRDSICDDTTYQPKPYKRNLNITYGGTTVTLPVNFDYTSGSTTYTHFSVGGGTSYHQISQLDASLWNWILFHTDVSEDSPNEFFAVSTGSAIVDGVSVNVVNISRLTEISIPTDVGIRSLENVNLLSTVTSINISSNAITDLWTGPFGSLTSFTLNNTAVAESELAAALSNATNLTTLDISGCYGIDYNNANIIAALNALTRLDVLELNADATQMSGGSIREVLLTAIKGSHIFGINQTGYAYSGYSTLGITSLHSLNKTTNINGNTGYSQIIQYYNARLAYQTTSHKLGITSTGSTLTQVGERVTHIDSNNDSRAKFPTDLYENDIKNEDGNGVQFELPSSFVFLGQIKNITWSSTGSNALITGNAQSGFLFKLDSSNYNSSWTSVTITGSFSGGSITHTFNIKKQTQVATSPSKLPMYYLEGTAVGQTGVGFTVNDDSLLVSALDVIKSGNFLQWLFNDCNNLKPYVKPLQSVTSNGNGTYSFVPSPSGVTTSTVGYYITYSGRQLVSLGNIANKGITTIDGIDIAFPNLNRFVLQTGAITNLDALASYELTHFEYTNSSNTYNHFISDFSPLLNSVDTLVTFRYAKDGYMTIDDLSFLTAFRKLETVDIYNRCTNRDNIASYLKMPSYRYMVAWFEVNQSGANTYNDEVAETKKAMSILSEFDVEGADFESSFEFLQLNEIDNQFGNNIIALKDNTLEGAMLPAYIDYGGTKYAIDWTTVSAHISIGGAVLSTASTYSVTDVGGNTVSVTDGSELTAAQLDQLLDDSSFVAHLYTGETSVGCPIEFVGVESYSSSLLQIIARIRVGNYDFERSLHIDIRKTSCFALLEETFNSYVQGNFTAANYQALTGIYNTAVADLLAQTNPALFENITNSAIVAMAAVPTI